MKKNILLIMLMAILFTIGGNIEVQAQRNNGNNSNKNYWNQVEKAEKERNKYIRKQNKELDKYYREVQKQEKKYYKKAAKRQKDYYKKLHKYGPRHYAPPFWAKAHGYDARNHIYFTDYRTFYDPYRCGYVYIKGGNWTFSVNIPSFLINVDLGRARTRVIRNVPINRHPEDFYGDYDYDYWND